MRRAEGNIAVSLLECVNPRKNKWRVRWDIQKVEGTENCATYMEEEFVGKPTPYEIETSISNSGVDASENELCTIGMTLGYTQEEFLRKFDIAHNERIASDPYAQLMEVVREQHLENVNVTDELALKAPATFFTFQSLCKRGKELKKGTVFRYGDKSWRVIQPHIPQEIYPPSMATASIYSRVEPAHAGTDDDPIPYEQGMAFTKGLYYSQYGVIYLCILTTENGYPNDLKDLPTIVQPIL
jgi:hypothetical protein